MIWNIHETAVNIAGLGTYTLFDKDIDSDCLLLLEGVSLGFVSPDLNIRYGYFRITNNQRTYAYPNHTILNFPLNLSGHIKIEFINTQANAFTNIEVIAWGHIIDQKTYADKLPEWLKQ